MGKYNSQRGKLFRTKEEICSEYLNALLKKGVIDESEIDYYKTPEGNREILKILVDKLYESEEYHGVKISTLDAWYHWCNFVIARDPSTDKKVWNRFVKDMFLDIEKNRYSCLLASRGLGKSYILYGLYSSFKCWLYDMTDIVIVSNTTEQITSNMRVLKRIIDSNELLLEKKDYGKGKDLIWTQTTIEFNGGIVESLTTRKVIRGRHINYFIIDDFMRDDNSISAEEYQNFIFGQVLPTVQVKKARVIVAGTPMYLGDIYHILMNTLDNGEGDIIRHGDISSKGFYSKAYPAIVNWEKKEVYLKDKYSWEELIENSNSIRNIQGERQFQREYMLICTDKSTSIFSKNLINSCCTNDYSYIQSPKNKDQLFVIGIDVATSGAASADYSAFLILEVIDTEKGVKKIVRHIVHEKGMEISAEKDSEGELLTRGQIETIAELYKRFNNAFTLVEKNNVGVALIQELQKMNVNVEEFITSKNSKINIIRYLVSEMQNGNLLIPNNSGVPEIESLKRELSNFGIYVNPNTHTESMKALAGHDDCVMALAFANYAASNMSSLPMAVLNDPTNR